MEITKQLVEAALADDTIEGDGHAIIDPKHYEPHFPREVLDEATLVHTHYSDGSFKGSIFSPEGKLLESVDGVNNLSFLCWVARRAGVEWMPAFGRGTEARHIVSALREWVAS
jgi:hypothetical protein|tara:strand:- start:339 stop:677 length:339 start_codon:yes stop_codon:yes gene_type:complete